MAHLSNNEVQIESQIAAESHGEQVNSAVDNSFFYTSDKFIDTLDTAEVLQHISNEYSSLQIDKTDSEIKAAILQMFDNDEFVNQVLDYFHLTILDLFKVLYSNFGALFKGAFVNKLKKRIEGHSYAKRITPNSLVH